jgi:putative holliday junction resolvase
MTKTYVGLDVGEKRIGVAIADDAVRISVAYDTIQVDGSEIEQIAEVVIRNSADKLIVGYPRNQSGEATAQTAYVEEFAKKLEDIAPIEFQDESLTSVIAEQRLEATKKPYKKEDIDATAAALILQDYLESH